MHIRDAFPTETADLDMAMLRHATMLNLLRARMGRIQARSRGDLDAYRQALDTIMHCEDMLPRIDAEIAEMLA